MLSSVPNHQKLFQIDYGSDSQDLEKEPQTERSHYADFARHNPEKQNKSPETQEIQVVKLQTSVLSSRHPPKSERTRCQPLRRNQSFKAKKNSQQDAQQPKPSVNKSLSKFINISQGDDFDTRSSGRFAVYEENYKNEKTLDATRNTSFTNSITLDVIKKAQQSPVLKISNFVRPEPKRKEAQRRELSFVESSNTKDKFGKKSNHCEKNVLDLLEKKLCEKTQNRPTMPTESKKEIKAPIKVEDVKNLSAFVHKPISSSHMLAARIKKLASGLNWLWPEYHMRDEKSGIHILSAKKKAANTTSNYYVSRSQKQIDVQNENYMGKIRANFVGSCFNIFSRGLNPESGEPGCKDRENVRKLLASVTYESQFGNSNPKSVKVYMLKPGYSYYDLEGTSIKSEQKSLQKLYEIASNKSKMWLCVNRKATYNKKLNRFVLNFEGRVKLPSTKNFILQEFESKREVLMFGKVELEEYVLQVSHPLTPCIALGVVLAEMDNKIICD